MPIFRWLNPGPLPPARDLRQCGWRLAGEGGGDPGCVALAEVASLADGHWRSFSEQPSRRRSILLLGVDESVERARLLQLGFGDALCGGLRLAELDARARRLEAAGEFVPRRRRAEELELDLVLRDGFAPRGPVQLHPREFDFLWRLMDTPGEPVSRTQLIRDVWRLAHVPETNSVAVHASRVRKKLADAGVSDVVRSSPCGGYFVVRSTPRALPLASPESPLDGHVRAADDG